MKCCLSCKKKFDKENVLCPNCTTNLCEMSHDVGDEINENKAAEIKSFLL